MSHKPSASPGPSPSWQLWGPVASEPLWVWELLEPSPPHQPRVLDPPGAEGGLARCCQLFTGARPLPGASFPK